MGFKLTDETSLARMVGRVEGVLSVRMQDGVEYTAQELLALCRLSGLEYTLAQYGQIAQALITEGFLEQV